jgi:hypothetical protein
MNRTALIELVRDCNRPITPADRHVIVKALETVVNVDVLISEYAQYYSAAVAIGIRPFTFQQYVERCVENAKRVGEIA